MVALNASDVADLCEEFAARQAAQAAYAQALKTQIGYLRTWIDAYRLLNRNNSLTDEDVKTRWKKAGYGGLHSY